MAFSDIFLGKPQQTKQIPLFSPEQMQARQQLRQGGQQQLQQNPLDFTPIENRYTKQFNEQIIPGLAERFTAMGGGQRSSAFKGALGNVGEDLAERLAALRSQYNLQANQQGFNQLRAGLTPEFQNQTIPGQPGILGNIATIGGQALGGLFGGPIGGAIGGQLGHGLSGLFQHLNNQQEESDPFMQLQQLFGSLNLPQSKIQQIMNILGAA